MSFIVSNSSNLNETISRMQLIQLLQLPIDAAAETTLNKELISNCFRVSVVPLLIHLLNETEKVLGSCLKACVHIVIGGQDSTVSGSGRGQHV
jgi:hypothetical protein